LRHIRTDLKRSEKYRSYDFSAHLRDALHIIDDVFASESFSHIPAEVQRFLEELRDESARIGEVVSQLRISSTHVHGDLLMQNILEAEDKKLLDY